MWNKTIITDLLYFPLFSMQSEVHDVLLGPAGSREDRPLQSARW